MAIKSEINDAIRRAFGRNATDDEIRRGASLSVGQLGDMDNLRALSGGRDFSQPSTQDILNQIFEQEQRRIQEMRDFVSSFEEDNPFAFDEQLATEVAESKFQPYYEKLFEDFVGPLQREITSSLEDQTRIIEELTRQEGRQTSETSRTIQNNLDAAAGGFARLGGFESGSRRRMQGETVIDEESDLEDFLAESAFKRESATLTGDRTRTQAEDEIRIKQDEIFGGDFDPSGGELGFRVSQDVGTQKQQAQSAYSDRLESSFRGRFGLAPASANISLPSFATS